MIAPGWIKDWLNWEFHGEVDYVFLNGMRVYIDMLVD